MGKRIVKRREKLKRVVIGHLRFLQKAPAFVRDYFRESHVRYVLSLCRLTYECIGKLFPFIMTQGLNSIHIAIASHYLCNLSRLLTINLRPMNPVGFGSDILNAQHFRQHI